MSLVDIAYSEINRFLEKRNDKKAQKEIGMKLLNTIFYRFITDWDVFKSILIKQPTTNYRNFDSKLIEYKDILIDIVAQIHEIIPDELEDEIKGIATEMGVIAETLTTMGPNAKNEYLDKTNNLISMSKTLNEKI